MGILDNIVQDSKEDKAAAVDTAADMAEEKVAETVVVADNTTDRRNNQHHISYHNCKSMAGAGDKAEEMAEDN